ncbi:MAG TPA: lysozyme inhibitor LprI family protein [Chthoniobacteraceae bacterium]|nr:lysozyme inhibitor LprI family protein [Chthoniobacteraceae bacterium]
MKWKIFAAVMAVCCCRAGIAGAPATASDWEERVVDLGTMKAAVYTKTETGDGHYAIGWTILRVDEMAKPVDWSLLDPWQPLKFLANYDVYGGKGRKPAYQFVGCMVDLQKKKWLALTGSGEAEAVLRSVSAAWGPSKNGRRYGFVETFSRLGPENLWLVTADASGMKQKDLLPALVKPAMRVVRDKRPLEPDGYFDDDLAFTIAGKGKENVSFHGETADVMFFTERENFWEDNDLFDVRGTARVRLADGAVVKAWSDTPRDSAEDHERFRLTDVGGTKVVIFTKTVSPDGRYGLGWTVLPVDKKKTSRVDWSEWDAHDCCSMDEYHIRDKDDPTAPYESVDCMVDLKEKKILRLPTDSPASAFYQAAFTDAEGSAYDFWHDPGFTGYDHGYFAAAWGPEVHGRRYALIENDEYDDPCPKFPHAWYLLRTHNLWLVTIDATGMRQREVTPLLDMAVAPLLADKRPADFDLFGVTYPVHPGHVTDKGAVFHGETATIPFDAESMAEIEKPQAVSGTVVLRLADGRVSNQRSDAERVDIMAATGGLAAADAELHNVYAKLLRALDPAAAAALKKEQQAWVDGRSTGAFEAEWTASGGGGPYPNDNAKARDQSLLESTQKRTAELKARMTND